MKTFVPFAGCTFEEGVLRSLMSLDDKRLGKQRVETYQVDNIYILIIQHINCVSSKLIY